MGGQLPSTIAQQGTVYLVGAGPGDPELLTLRAASLLATADVVFYDDLVPDAVLELCGVHTERVSVGKRCGNARITQAGIHVLLVEAAQAGRSVVRLKSGDPLIFGRAAEELAALAQAEIPVQIVPGVTALFAAAAALHLPLTDRRSASKLILMAGRHAADKSEAGPLWTGAVPPDATLAIYMPGRDLQRLAQDLLSIGIDPATPCAAISQAATPEQSVAAARLHQFGQLAPGPAPLLVVVGAAVETVLTNALASPV